MNTDLREGGKHFWNVYDPQNETTHGKWQGDSAEQNVTPKFFAQKKEYKFIMLYNKVQLCRFMIKMMALELIG